MDENKVNGSENIDEEILSDEELKLRAEMDELARTFQEELDKAKAEEEIRAAEQAKEQEILIQELEDDVRYDTETPDEIPEEELCECCGEKRRGTKDNPDSPYCRDCERGLRRYPFELLNVLIVLIVLGLSVVACINFAQRTQIYAAAARAQHLEKQKLLYTSYSAYDNVIGLMKDKELNGELVYQRAVRNMLLIDMVDDMGTYENQFKLFELKLPHLKTAYNTFRTYEGYRLAQLDGYQVLYEEAQKIEDGDYSKLPYAEIVGRIDALLSVSTEESYKYQESLGEGAEESPSYLVKIDNYDPAMMEFFKFYAAALSGQDNEIQIAHLEKVRAAYPELTWLYGAFLGDLYNKSGKDVEELCKQLESYNAEDSTADIIRTTNLRINGKRTDAIALAQKNIDKGSPNAYEFYRQQAICYLLDGDFDKAYSAAGSGYENYQYSVQVCEVYAIASIAAGRTDSYDEVVKLFEENGVKMSDEVLAYKDGTVSLEEIFAQGDYDIQ
ncbi:MAG: hypothetical protein Q3968_07875 [Clostridiaceae bacterium]|nr:hypothetical protein [Clostridiaceae bacterium]